MKKRGLLVSRQIATARAFAAWLAEPSVQDQFELTLLYYPPSTEAVNRLSIPKKPVHSFETPDSHAYDFILTGTSAQSEDDAKYFAWARQHGITSFAFVDQWINYSLRFVTAHLPDHVLVVDKIAATECMEEVPGSYEVHAAGSPALSALQDFWKQHQRKPHHARHLYFATEPISLKDGDAEYLSIHGINDLTAFEHLARHIEEHQSDKWTVSLLLHPIDRIDRWQHWLNQNTTFKNMALNVTNFSKNEVLCHADLIAGMRSFLLLESGLLGLPTLSLQINRLTESGLTDEKQFIHLATKTEQINLNISAGPVQTENLQNHWTETIQRLLKN